VGEREGRVEVGVRERGREGGGRWKGVVRCE